VVVVAVVAVVGFVVGRDPVLGLDDLAAAVVVVEIKSFVKIGGEALALVIAVVAVAACVTLVGRVVVDCLIRCHQTLA